MPDTAVNLDASPAVPVIRTQLPYTTAVNLAPLSAESLSGSRRNYPYHLLRDHGDLPWVFQPVQPCGPAGRLHERSSSTAPLVR